MGGIWEKKKKAPSGLWLNKCLERRPGETTPCYEQF